MNGKSSRLPPLPALRAFEAVARAKSVRDAAQELGLTPSAISHQLKNLEDHLGIALLKRGNQSIELTPLGEQFAAYIERGFTEFRQGLDALTNDPERGVLRVSAAPLFAMEVLLPSLADFERVSPGLKVQLEVGESLADLDSGPTDIAIRIGDVPSANYFYETLLESCWAPVCAPSLLSEGNPLVAAEQLRNHVLLVSPEGATTQRWFELSGNADVKCARELHFDSFLGALQAAQHGLGVAIAPLSLISRHLKEGRLVAPLEFVLPSPWPYRFVCRRGRERLPKVDRFRTWLKALCEIQRTMLPKHCGQSLQPSAA
jgi:LysR family glycine cleavage system transcriptional activator